MSRRKPREYNADTRQDDDFPYLTIDEYFEFPECEYLCGSVVAVGGNLSPGMLISGYRQGIFPWFNEDDPILWQSPNPRFVIFPETFKIPSRLERVIKKRPFEIRVDTDFERVITYCSAVVRPGQDGSWITDDMVDAYLVLHQLGLAHSIEAWENNTLVGGFYGICIGSVFFGESMFTRLADASKIAFATFAKYFFSTMKGTLIDSQVYTDHISRFGGLNVSRSVYLRKLKESLPENLDNRGPWKKDLLQEALFSSVNQG